ncbi:MAG: ribosome small subunit-dependent GTPase A, partial [Ignavibacteriae bacterium]|nr:ribosome small subunit-dependent GTPase A [Ignavibacteriota bacterium]
MNLIDLGLHSTILEDNIKNSGFATGRIISVNKESYNISDGKNEYFGRITGNMMYSSESPEDYPTVGDFVQFQNFENDTLAIIHKILPRKTLLKRKSSGKNVEFQLIAANIDFAIIIQSLDNDFNINRLERYLSMSFEFNIEPIILFSKSDLAADYKIEEILNKIRDNYKNIEILFFSNFDEDSLAKIEQKLQPRKTYCMIGSSGVGKTTLLNNLIGSNEFKTNDVRKGDNRGKHTTTNRQLVVLKNGSMIIDTPGMRELANISISDGIEKTFDEITELAENCKYTDCTHTVEKGCAILEA